MECPHCGAHVPRGAAACPECGSDESTGWGSGEEIDYASVEIPDVSDPDECDGREAQERGRKVVIGLLVAALALGAVAGLRALLGL